MSLILFSFKTSVIDDLKRLFGDWFQYFFKTFRALSLLLIENNNWVYNLIYGEKLPLKENKINEIEFIYRLISKNQNSEESKKLLIDFAIYFNNWSIARNNIKGLIGTNPSREICLFMSEIELGEFSDIQKSEGWKLRANNAGSDYYWVCKFTNSPQKNWSALSDSGHFNSLEWIKPKMLSVI